MRTAQIGPDLRLILGRPASSDLVLYLNNIALYISGQNSFQTIVVFNEIHLLYACAYHTSLKPVRVRGGMSLRNGMWHGLRNELRQHRYRNNFRFHLH